MEKIPSQHLEAIANQWNATPMQKINSTPAPERKVVGIATTTQIRRIW
jgi:hypothetical protein